MAENERELLKQISKLKLKIELREQEITSLFGDVIEYPIALSGATEFFNHLIEKQVRTVRGQKNPLTGKPVPEILDRAESLLSFYKDVIQILSLQYEARRNYDQTFRVWVPSVDGRPLLHNASWSRSEMPFS